MVGTSEFEVGNCFEKPATTKKTARYLKAGDRVLFITSNGLIGEWAWKAYWHKLVVMVGCNDIDPSVIEVAYAVPGKKAEDTVYYHPSDILQVLDDVKGKQ